MNGALFTWRSFAFVHLVSCVEVQVLYRVLLMISLLGCVSAQAFPSSRMQRAIVNDDPVDVLTEMKGDRNFRANLFVCIYLASKNRSIHALSVLMQALDIYVTVNNQRRNKPLHTAAWQGLVVAAEALLSGGSPIDAADAYGWTPLHIASSRGDVALVELFLARGADSTLQTNGGMQPMHLAVFAGHIEVVEVLSRFGAALDQEDENGNTPYDIAIDESQHEIAELLLNLEQDRDRSDQDEPPGNNTHFELHLLANPQDGSAQLIFPIDDIIAPHYASRKNLVNL